MEGMCTRAETKTVTHHNHNYDGGETIHWQEGRQRAAGRDPSVFRRCKPLRATQPGQVFTNATIVKNSNISIGLYIYKPILILLLLTMVINIK